MPENQPKPTTMRLSQQDRADIERVKELYGCPSDSAAIRLALRIVARQEQKGERVIAPHVSNTGVS